MNKIILWEKLKAFLTHLSISLVVIGGFSLFVIFVLYTPTVLKLEGGYEIAMIIFLVDISLGPILTAVVYRKGKKGMKGDLVLIALLQVSAFLYGAHALYSQRPSYIAYTVDLLKIVPASQIELAKLSDSRLMPSSLKGPKWVFVEKPTGEKGQEALLTAIATGRDIDLFPEFYRDYDDNLDSIRAKARVMDKIKRDRNLVVSALNALLEPKKIKQDNVVMLPILGRDNEMTAVLDKRTLKLIGYIDVIIQ